MFFKEMFRYNEEKTVIDCNNLVISISHFLLFALSFAKILTETHFPIVKEEND